MHTSKLSLPGQETASRESMLNVKLARSGGVGFRAKGYSLTSREDKGAESLNWKGGYDRFVVVVVVIVFVSIHSATSNCILECDR